MTNQPLFDVGTLWQDEVAYVPVYVETTEGSAADGLASGGFEFRYSKNGAAMAAMVPSDCVEVASGIYELTLPASMMDTSGMFIYCAQRTTPGYTAFKGIGHVEARRDEWRVCAVPAYSYSSQRLVYIVWLEHNGQRIATPTSAHLYLYKEGGITALVDADGGTANADGVFTIVETPLALEQYTVYEVKATVVNAGVTYTSIRGHQSLG